MTVKRRPSILCTAAILAAAVLTASAPASAAASPQLVSDPASLVNTLVATTGGGNVFPGPDVPFGMIQWSPDTRRRTAGGGYRYDQTQLRGFSLTHISGPGCGAYGDVPILPLTGGLPPGDPGSFMESFSHTGEVATAGYYSVKVGSPAITTELTSTLRSAMGRFTYPATTNANMLLKLLDSQNGTVASDAKIVGRNEVQGMARSGRFCGAPDLYNVYFDITFDHPFRAPKVIREAGQPGPNSVFLTFDTTASQVLQAKVGISFVSSANAKLNRETDNPGWNFDAVRSAAHATWNALLSKIQIGGGTTDQQALFYTMLYRVLLHPNVWSDANGEYVGFDQKIHTVKAPQEAQYANFSGWDTYHSQVQLSSLLAPEESSDQAQSLLNDAAESPDGVIPPWGFANSANYVMVGDPGTALLAGYYAFGARGFDTATALEVMMKQATTVNNVRPGQALQDQYGYLPEDADYGCCNFYGSVGTLLEDNQADFALAQYASALGDTADATMLVERAQNWQNVFNANSSLMQPKLLSGQFVSGIGPTSSQGMVEGTAAQYRWVVPFNHASLIAALGGNEAVNPLLDGFFTTLDGSSPAGAFLANEFELGVQMMYDYTRQPWKTQAVVNRMRNENYKLTPTGLRNNDDLGALSSMYVWSALGMYPEIPGSAQLVINGPAFPLAIVHLANGNTITINAPGASPSSPYIQSLNFNGHPYSRLWFGPSLVTDGGALDYTMGSSANTSWGASPLDTPPSYGTQYVAAAAFVSPDSQAIVSPGGTTTTNLGVQSTWDAPQTITWTATPSDGVTVTPSSGSLVVNQGGRRTVPVTVTGGASEGRETVAFHLTSSTGVKVGDVVLGLAVARPGALWPYYNNIGISDDTNMAAANYDGVGFSYSAQALAAAGVTPGSTVSADGFSYTWPDFPAGQLDNIEAGGQTIQLAPTSGKTRIGLLGSATNVGSGGSQGTMVVHYSDGTSQQVTVGFSDWTLGAGAFGPAFGNTTAVTTAYRNCVCGVHDNVKTYVFALNAPLTAGKTVTSITLPATVTGGQFHVFDVKFR
ncbi:MAG TPA: GH92 family glycosyl hydrolase [Actinomycetes bacterium]|nr:GH92 family glycosyl hydrolase [Actinomycetes bacterium]